MYIYSLCVCIYIYIHAYIRTYVIEIYFMVISTKHISTYGPITFLHIYFFICSFLHCLKGCSITLKTSVFQAHVWMCFFQMSFVLSAITSHLCVQDVALKYLLAVCLHSAKASLNYKPPSD